LPCLRGAGQDLLLGCGGVMANFFPIKSSPRWRCRRGPAAWRRLFGRAAPRWSDRAKGQTRNGRPDALQNALHDPSHSSGKRLLPQAQGPRWNATLSVVGAGWSGSLSRRNSSMRLRIVLKSSAARGR